MFILISNLNILWHKKWLIDCSIGNLQGCNSPGWPLFVAILSAFVALQVAMVVSWLQSMNIAEMWSGMAYQYCQLLRFFQRWSRHNIQDIYRSQPLSNWLLPSRPTISELNYSVWTPMSFGKEKKKGGLRNETIGRLMQQPIKGWVEWSIISTWTTSKRLFCMHRV